MIETAGPSEPAPTSVLSANKYVNTYFQGRTCLLHLGNPVFRANFWLLATSVFHHWLKEVVKNLAVAVPLHPLFYQHLHCGVVVLATFPIFSVLG